MLFHFSVHCVTPCISVNQIWESESIVLRILKSALKFKLYLNITQKKKKLCTIIYINTINSTR